MINIQPYHDKLNALEEYLHLRINNRYRAIKQQIQYKETGFIMFGTHSIPDFETWYNNKLNNTSKWLKNKY